MRLLPAGNSPSSRCYIFQKFIGVCPPCRGQDAPPVSHDTPHKIAVMKLPICFASVGGIPLSPAVHILSSVK